MLTLIVLPTIYEWLENRKQSTETEAAIGLRDIPELTGISNGECGPAAI